MFANAHLTSHPMRARIVGFVAKLLGVHVHIEGFPFGASYPSVSPRKHGPA